MYWNGCRNLGSSSWSMSLREVLCKGNDCCSIEKQNSSEERRKEDGNGRQKGMPLRTGPERKEGRAFSPSRTCILGTGCKWGREEALEGFACICKGWRPFEFTKVESIDLDDWLADLVGGYSQVFRGSWEQTKQALLGPKIYSVL